MENKCIVIGVSGGIAAYKAASLVSSLKKKGHDVHVIMTRNATEFISPLTFETLSSNRVSVDTFDRNFEYNVNHISLAKKADVFALVPASANVIAKVANGIADDMLTTTFLASSAIKIICPAMNTGMLENEVTQNNLNRCRELGYQVVQSATGYLACGDVGSGRLAAIEDIETVIEYALYKEKTLVGKKVLISAGSTMEKLDPVRYIRNHSTGKMGFALAKVAKALGAEVTLVKGISDLPTPVGVDIITTLNAKAMFEYFKEHFHKYDFIIKAAAVSDYTCAHVEEHKIKKSTATINLELNKTNDILKWLGEHKLAHQKCCGFAMETENLLENAKDKLLSKQVDMIVANSLSTPNAGFAHDTNVASIVTKEEIISLPLMTKEELAYTILEALRKG